MIINTPVDKSNEIEVVKNTLGYTYIPSSKNLVKNTATSTTTNGVTFTVNDDGSVTANGTASAAVMFYFNADFNLPNGEYILSGCPEGGATTSYYIDIIYYKDGGQFKASVDTGEGNTFVIDASNNAYSKLARIYIYNGTKINNLTFYPMIRKADVTDDTYEMYFKGNENVDTRLNSMEWKLVGSGKNVKLPSDVINNFKEILVCNNYYYSYSNTYYTATTSNILTREIYNDALEKNNSNSAFKTLRFFYGYKSDAYDTLINFDLTTNNFSASDNLFIYYR